MEVISDRVSILNKDKVLSIVILPTADKKKLGLLFLWLMAWTVCGVLVFVNYFSLTNQDAKLFVIIYLSFWAYFEFKIARAFSWKKFGKEKIWFKNGKLHYQRELNGRGKIKEFDPALINDLTAKEIDERDFSDFINKSFWIKGGERIQFQYQGRYILMGLQLSDRETLAVFKYLQNSVVG
jgi:hypothetical protein